MLKVLKAEPVAITGVVQAALALVVTLGFNLSAAAVGAILAVVAATLALVARSQVTPVATGPAVIPAAPAPPAPAPPTAP